MLPVCGSARRYEFSILFYSQEASTTAILEAILQMPPINFSTNVAFNFYQPYGGILPQLLPVDAISVWLNRSNDMVMKCNRQQKKLLELKVSFKDRIQNVHQLFEHFKKVHFAYSLIKSKKSAHNKLQIRQLRFSSEAAENIKTEETFSREVFLFWL